MEIFADVIIPVPLGRLYTYRVPEALQKGIGIGARVVVSFGKQKLYTGVISNLHSNLPEGYKAKNILELLDDYPVVPAESLQLWDWIANYYLCTPGDALNAALPSSMKLQSEMKIILVADAITQNQLFTPEEELLIAMLQEQEAGSTIGEIAKKIQNPNPLPLIRSMIDAGYLRVEEKIPDAITPKKVRFVGLSEKAQEEKFMSALFQQLEKRAPKQLEVLMHLLKISAEHPNKPVKVSKLLKESGASGQVLDQLVKKDAIIVFEDDDQIAYEIASGDKLHTQLSASQDAAAESVSNGFENDQPVLLHGVTGSGKTEIYISFIDEFIKKGKQVLYLLPEIALTTQIINRLKVRFGEQVLVYHSRLSPRERMEVYYKVLNDGPEFKYKFPLIIGVRSAVLLPFSNPGLIIVDEEHDTSYKQTDPAPRYNGRDVAVTMAKMRGAKVLLGSATPSFESYYNAEQGKYHLVKLNERHGGLEMPSIEIVDLKAAYAKGAVKSGFSLDLSNGIKHALHQKEQVILFQNRRGFAPVLECKHCGWIPQCKNCDVSLTYHKKSNALKCHYCGYAEPLPGQCPACESTDLRMKGLGTERIEDDAAMLFEDVTIQRLDFDTTGSKYSYQRILDEFSNGTTDILVGTQMVTKGLDFDNVSLVGVLNADQLLSYPDFRASERSYQLLAQVSGRAGRKFRRGKVLVQSFNPAHPLFIHLTKNDYTGFYHTECKERETFKYPPFYRLISFRMRHKDERIADSLSAKFVRMLKRKFGSRILGPVPPPVARIRNYYIRNAVLKMEKNISDHAVKTQIKEVMNSFYSISENRPLIIQPDVDPQ